MNRTHFSALLGLELKRVQRLVLRLLIATVGVAVLLAVAGQGDAGTLIAVCLGTGIGVALTVPMGVSRDKMEHTLEFLCGLPTAAATVAAAKFAAAALVVLPWAALTACAIGWFGVLHRFGLGGVVAVPAALLGVWTMLSLLSWVLAAFLARFELEMLMGVPLGILVVILLVVPRVLDAIGPRDPAAALQWFLRQPWAPAAIAAAAVALVVGIAALAFATARKAIATYRPRPAQL